MKSYDKNKGGVHTKKREGIPVVEKREGRGV